MTEPEWRTTVEWQLVRPGGTRVLPAIELPGRLWADEPRPLQEALLRECQVDAVLLKALSEKEDTETGERHLTLLGADRDDFTDGLTPEWHVPEPGDAPWAGPGWIHRTTRWLAGSLPPGATVAGPAEQVRIWELSCVLRVPTTGGDVYVKSAADSPLFVDEGAVVTVLHRHFPGRVPAPLAHDPGARLLAMRPFPPEIGHQAPPEVQAEVLGAYGRFQAATPELTAELTAAGCGERTLPWLADQLSTWAATLDHTVVPPGADPASWLDEEEARAIRSAVPDLLSAVERLAAYGLPDCAVHGDFHLANVARADGGFVFFDWTDAGVGHPFLDLVTLYWQPNPAALDAYLAAWTAYASPERLREAWELAEPLVAVNQAISYAAIVSVLPPGGDPTLKPMIARWLRRLLTLRS
ncbi:MAG: aminoglycoside phosphotransferase family protein [Thermoactinospora sp.]|nr:aminoglycoside phosphotransferase family protein [Thermoactinospora sp.]